MLNDAHRRGFEDAFARYGVKRAFLDRFLPDFNARASNIKTRQEGRAAFMPGSTLHGLGKNIEHNLIGHLGEGDTWRKGLSNFKPGGAFHWKNVLWPSSTLGKIVGVGLPAYLAYKAIKGESGNPNEGRLSNALGTVGHALGSAYGYTMGGMLTGGAAGGAGESLGRGLGRLLGSRPDASKQQALPPGDFQPAPQGGY